MLHWHQLRECNHRSPWCQLAVKHLLLVKKIVAIVDDGETADLVRADEDHLVPVEAFETALAFSMRMMPARKVYDLSVMLIDYVSAMGAQDSIPWILFPDVVSVLINRDSFSQVFACWIQREKSNFSLLFASLVNLQSAGGTSRGIAACVV